MKIFKSFVISFRFAFLILNANQVYGGGTIYDGIQKNVRNLIYSWGEAPNYASLNGESFMVSTGNPFPGSIDAYLFPRLPQGVSCPKLLVLFRGFGSPVQFISNILRINPNQLCVLITEYRGSRSKDPMQSKTRALEEDAYNGFLALKNVSRINSNTEIYVGGASLGGGFASSFAARLVHQDPEYGKNIKGIFVASTYVSFGMIAVYRFNSLIYRLDPNLLPLESLGGFGGKGTIQDVAVGAIIDLGLNFLGEGLDTARSLKTLQSKLPQIKILIIGETKDSVIPVWHSQSIFRACSGQRVDADEAGTWKSGNVQLTQYANGHTEFINNPAFYQEIKNMI